MWLLILKILYKVQFRYTSYCMLISSLFSKKKTGKQCKDFPFYGVNIITKINYYASCQYSIKNLPVKMESQIIATDCKHSVTQKGDARDCSNWRTIVLISYASKFVAQDFTTKTFTVYGVQNARCLRKYHIATICWLLAQIKELGWESVCIL